MSRPPMVSMGGATHHQQPSQLATLIGEDPSAVAAGAASRWPGGVERVAYQMASQAYWAVFAVLQAGATPMASFPRTLVRDLAAPIRAELQRIGPAYLAEAVSTWKFHVNAFTANVHLQDALRSATPVDLAVSGPSVAELFPPVPPALAAVGVRVDLALRQTESGAYRYGHDCLTRYTTPEGVDAPWVPFGLIPPFRRAVIAALHVGVSAPLRASAAALAAASVKKRSPCLTLCEPAWAAATTDLVGRLTAESPPDPLWAGGDWADFAAGQDGDGRDGGRVNNPLVSLLTEFVALTSHVADVPRTGQHVNVGTGANVFAGVASGGNQQWWSSIISGFTLCRVALAHWAEDQFMLLEDALPAPWDEHSREYMTYLQGLRDPDGDAELEWRVPIIIAGRVVQSVDWLTTLKFQSVNTLAFGGVDSLRYEVLATEDTWEHDAGSMFTADPPPWEPLMVLRQTLAELLSTDEPSLADAESLVRAVDRVVDRTPLESGVVHHELAEQVLLWRRLVRHWETASGGYERVLLWRPAEGASAVDRRRDFMSAVHDSSILEDPAPLFADKTMPRNGAEHIRTPMTAAHPDTGDYMVRGFPVRAAPIDDAGKIRTVTAASPLAPLLRPTHGRFKEALQRQIPAAKYSLGTPGVRGSDARAGAGAVPAFPSACWVSADYSAATDGLNQRAVLCATAWISGLLGLPLDLRVMLYHTLTLTTIVRKDGPGRVAPLGHQTRGQLMGAFCSFPLLCALNLAMLRACAKASCHNMAVITQVAAARAKTAAPTGGRFHRDRVLRTYNRRYPPIWVNGDDAVILVPHAGAFMQSWDSMSAVVGLARSVGKMFFTYVKRSLQTVGRGVVTLNSKPVGVTVRTDPGTNKVLEDVFIGATVPTMVAGWLVQKPFVPAGRPSKTTREGIDGWSTNLRLQAQFVTGWGPDQVSDMTEADPWAIWIVDQMKSSPDGQKWIEKVLPQDATNGMVRKRVKQSGRPPIPPASDRHTARVGAAGRLAVEASLTGGKIGSVHDWVTLPVVYGGLGWPITLPAQLIRTATLLASTVKPSSITCALATIAPLSRGQRPVFDALLREACKDLGFAPHEATARNLLSGTGTASMDRAALIAGAADLLASGKLGDEFAAVVPALEPDTFRRLVAELSLPEGERDYRSVVETAAERAEARGLQDLEAIVSAINLSALLAGNLDIEPTRDTVLDRLRVAVRRGPPADLGSLDLRDRARMLLSHGLVPHTVRFGSVAAQVLSVMRLRASPPIEQVVGATPILFWRRSDDERHLWTETVTVGTAVAGTLSAPVAGVPPAAGAGAGAGAGGLVAEVVDEEFSLDVGIASSDASTAAVLSSALVDIPAGFADALRSLPIKWRRLRRAEPD